jgi:hypothetical protein
MEFFSPGLISLAKNGSNPAEGPIHPAKLPKSRRFAVHR